MLPTVMAMEYEDNLCVIAKLVGGLSTATPTSSRKAMCQVLLCCTVQRCACPSNAGAPPAEHSCSPIPA
eukprot:1154925-Pelagomonas_calceolata.AAC.9